MSNEEKITLDEANCKVTDYSCPSCGAPVTYSPEKGVLFCEYCGNTVELDKNKSNEEFDFSDGIKEDNSWAIETKVVHCDNCGANNVIDSNEISTSCPFCGSNHVVETSEISGIKPHRVVPFKVASKTIDDNYRTWLKKKLFAPSKVKKQIPNLIINGVYLPIWTFDSNTFSVYDGRLGKRYTRTIGSGKNRRTVTEIRYFHIRGNKNITFDDVITNAGSKIQQAEMDRLSPFDTNNSFEYERGFLAGYSSEHYSVKLNKGWENAKVTINGVIKREILKKYNYDVVSYLNINTKYHDIKYKYVLIPIWIGLYKYANKEYRFLANGENGKVTGKAPVSALRVSIAVILGIIFVILITLWIYSV